MRPVVPFLSVCFPVGGRPDGLRVRTRSMTRRFRGVHTRGVGADRRNAVKKLNDRWSAETTRVRHTVEAHNPLFRLNDSHGHLRCGMGQPSNNDFIDQLAMTTPRLWGGEGAIRVLKEVEFVARFVTSG